jgi:hypothetical protein
MNTERVPTPGERELTRYRDEIRALHADEVDLLRIEETIVQRLKVIGVRSVRPPGRRCLMGPVRLSDEIFSRAFRSRLSDERTAG